MARQNADQRREAVLRAAVTQLGRCGQDGASTTAIAQGAGIPQGYLFRLLPSKRALFLAAVERAFRATEAAPRSSADGSGALEDAECQEIARRGFVRLWRTVAELTRRRRRRSGRGGGVPTALRPHGQTLRSAP